MVKSDLFNQFIEEEQVPEISREADPDLPAIDPNTLTSMLSDQSESPVISDEGEPFVDSANCSQYGVMVLDDFVEKEQVELLNEHIYNQGLPLYIAVYRNDREDVRLGKWEPLKDSIDFHNWQLNHPFLVNGEWVGNHKHIVEGLIDTINPVAKLNAHGIINPGTTNQILIGGYHCKYVVTDVPIYTAILYLNTNNGYTTFEGGFNVRNVANRLLIFPSQLYYGTVSCTDIQHAGQISMDFVHSPSVFSKSSDTPESNENE